MQKRTRDETRGVLSVCEGGGGGEGEGEEGTRSRRRRGR